MTTNSLAQAFADSDREFWHGVLTGGGFTPIPRWTLDPVPGVAVCEAAVPRDLLPALRQRAAEVRVPLSSVLLAAHATVMAALSGEPEVVTGYLAGIRGVPLPCRLATAPGSWRAALLQAHQIDARLQSLRGAEFERVAARNEMVGPPQAPARGVVKRQARRGAVGDEERDRELPAARRHSGDR